MSRRRMSPVVLVTVCSGLLACSVLAASRGTDVRTLVVAGHERLVRVHVPDSSDERPPLLLVFHGGAGNARRAQRSFGFDRLADEQGVVIAYPEALNSHWNDGRKGKRFATQDAEVDDVDFVMAWLDAFGEEEAFDPARVYAVGASNGGMFVQRLVLEHPDRFAAVAVLIANLPAPLEDGFEDRAAAADSPSMLFMNGTEDPLMPFAGGEVTVNLFPRLNRHSEQPSRGEVLSTARTLELWAQALGLDGAAVIEEIEDRDPDDGTTVRVHRWSPGEDAESEGSPSGQAELVLWEIVGGGHTLPGGGSTFGERVIGRTSRELDAVEVVWSFLAFKHRAR